MNGNHAMSIGSRVLGGVIGLLLPCLLLVGAVGCGKGDTIIKGTVTYDGTPITNGTIEFDTKIPIGGSINEDGTGSFYFKVDSARAQTGKFKVQFKPSGDKATIKPKGVADNLKIQKFATSGVEVELTEGKTNELTIAFKK